MTKNKKLLSAIIVLTLLASGTAVLWSDHPDSDPNQLTEDLPLDTEDPIDVAAGPSVLGPVAPQSDEIGSDDQGVRCDEPSLTNLAVFKEACGYWKQEIVYDWCLEKTIIGGEGVVISEDGHSASVMVAQGNTVTIQYQIVAERVLVQMNDIMGVCGQVTVRNTGLYPTENLMIMDHIQIAYDCDYVDIATFQIDVSDHPVLLPGESYSYSYNFEFDAIAGMCYRNLAIVSISNLECETSSIHAADAFLMPDEPCTVVVDEMARLIESLQCPEGYLWILDLEGPWTLQDSRTVIVNVQVTNVDAVCDSVSYLRNIVRLTELDTCQCHQDCTCVALTWECECNGYTLTIGYWKNHDGSGPQADEITPLIIKAGGTIWLGTPNGEYSVAVKNAAEAVNYLDRQGKSSNGINRLYAQLLAAKLNILNGACDDAIEETIAAADAFLATHGADEWDDLTADEKQDVNGWKDMADDYNNGVIGPGHSD